MPPAATGGRRHDLIFTAAEREARLLGPSGPVSRVWTYTDEPFGVTRIRLGDTLRAQLVNRLPEHTSMHWHGVRVPNSQDGVQYLTQPPVNPGETFTYEFTPPDTGTFFFHPHCNEVGQIGRGLAGTLIVEGDEQETSHADIVLANKDWRLAENGSWLPFHTNEGASRAGTFGNVRAVNGVQDFSRDVPAHGDVRLRILNLDASRTIEVGVEGAEAYVIATDGNPIAPFPLHSWKLGTAMRLDVLVRAPKAGRSFKVIRLLFRRTLDAGDAQGRRVQADAAALFAQAPLRVARAARGPENGRAQDLRVQRRDGRRRVRAGDGAGRSAEQGDARRPLRSGCHFLGHQQGVLA